MKILGVTLPDIPDDAFTTYPYGAIVRQSVNGEAANYYLAAMVSEGMLVPKELTGNTNDMVSTIDVGFSLWTYVVGESEDWGEPVVYSENTPNVSIGETEQGTFHVVWSNHDIFGAGIDMATYEVLKTHLYFPKTEVELEQRSSAFSEHVLELGQQARRLSLGMVPLDMKGIVQAFSGVTVPEEGSDWMSSAAYTDGVLSSDAETITWPQFVIPATDVQAVSFPNAKSIGSYAFQNGSSILNVDFPEAESIGSSVCAGCTKLTDLELPKAKSIGIFSFASCSALTKVDLGSAENLSDYAFYACRNLDTVIIRTAAQVCTITDVVLMSTKLSSGDGLLYVPAELVDAYKGDTAWAALLSSPSDQVVSLDHIIFGEAGAKTTAYGLTMSLKIPFVYYGDGMAVTAVSGDSSIVTVGTVTIEGGKILVPVTGQSTTGTTQVTVTATSGEVTESISFDVNVVETLPDPTYAVEAVSGASYGFALNDAGYYESSNQGVTSSYSLCKVTFNTQGYYTLYLDCINDGESNYDFGILSQVDTTLNLSFVEDSANVFKSFKGLSGTEVQTVDYGVPNAGEHFIYVKYKKDGSGDTGSDSLQFKVRME